MKITPMYVAMLPDGTIFEGGTTAESAARIVKAQGVENVVVDDIGDLREAVLRNNPLSAPARTSLRGALKIAGLPESISKEEVFALTPEAAVARIRPLFSFLVSEQRQSVLEPDEETGEMKRVNRARLDANGRPVYAETKFVSSKNPEVWANELMSRNLKLVKDTLNSNNPTSLRTRRSGDLIGLNLYPANSLTTKFTKTYGPYSSTGFSHPISQIILALQATGNLPEDVDTLPTGMQQQTEVVPLSAVLTPAQQARVKNAFSKKSFTTCTKASTFCSETCLVYTGQNAAAFQNDWKKATCLFALVADPVAYLRLIIHALDTNGTEAAADGIPFFVRMNLLSDIPWEEMVPWLFKLYQDAPSDWYTNYPRTRANPRANPRSYTSAQRKKVVAGYGSGQRPFAIQFYDYTKLDARDPASEGVTNYDLTYSFSGINFTAMQEALYGRGQRIAVVFAGFKARTVDGREVYSRALYTATKNKNETVEEAEDKAAKYGYGLPKATDMFARPQDKRAPDKGMRKIVNADRHDARPLDPPNTLDTEPCISGLAWKSTSGGVTVSNERKNQFMFRATQEDSEWVVRAPSGGDLKGAVVARFGKKGKGRAEKEATRLTGLENIRQAGAFVTPTLLVEDTNTYFRALGKEEVKVLGIYVVAETPRETGVGSDALSDLPGGE